MTTKINATAGTTGEPRKWHIYNNAPKVEHPHHGDFKVTAPPNTDIWRRTDEDDVFNAPMIHQMIGGWEFKKIHATVGANWKTQYDQGGLILTFPSKYGDLKDVKSIKAGVEYYNGHCYIAVAGTDRYSDWSIVPMSHHHPPKVTFCLERIDNSLWVYAAQQGSEKLQPIRELKWTFQEHRLHDEIWVGVYAAKPLPDPDDPTGKNGLEVEFSNLMLEEVIPDD